ncbi:MAG: hypothetical protein O3B75_10025, partial [Planctomycetota bacterium]|nr:hypothetical protein [Planctomycetota bacterium]
ARENFPAAGNASGSSIDTATETAADTVAETAAETAADTVAETAAEAFHSVGSYDAAYRTAPSIGDARGMSNRIS